MGKLFLTKQLIPTKASSLTANCLNKAITRKQAASIFSELAFEQFHAVKLTIDLSDGMWRTAQWPVLLLTIRGGI